MQMGQQVLQKKQEGLRAQSQTLMPSGSRLQSQISEVSDQRRQDETVTDFISKGWRFLDSRRPSSEPSQWGHSQSENLGTSKPQAPGF